MKYREAFGLTQEEAAQFLKIPKSLLVCMKSVNDLYQA